MSEFVPGEGEQVRIDIPDETDPDHRLHGMHGRAVDIIEDDAGAETGDERILPSTESVRMTGIRSTYGGAISAHR